MDAALALPVKLMIAMIATAGAGVLVLWFVRSLHGPNRDHPRA